MKRQLLIATAFVVATSAVAFAQGPRGPHGPGGPGGPGHRMERIAEALKLTDAQKATWKELHESKKEQMQAFHEEGRTLHEAVRAALAEQPQDSAKVGAAVIALDAHRKKMQDMRKEMETALAATLDADQKVRFETLKSMHGPGPGGPGGHRGGGFMHGAPPPPDGN